MILASFLLPKYSNSDDASPSYKFEKALYAHKALPRMPTAAAANRHCNAGVFATTAIPPQYRR